MLRLDAMVKAIKERANPPNVHPATVKQALWQHKDDTCRERCKWIIYHLFYGHADSIFPDMNRKCPKVGRLVGAFFVDGNPTVQVAGNIYATYRWDDQKNGLRAADLVQIKNANQAMTKITSHTGP